jgi:hypothetical protein
MWQQGLDLLWRLKKRKEKKRKEKKAKWLVAVAMKESRFLFLPSP